MTSFPGSNHPQAKLTEAIVAALRRRARKAHEPVGWIKVEAKRLGVAPTTLLMAIGGRTWVHVNEPPVAAWARHAFKFERAPHKQRR